MSTSAASPDALAWRPLPTGALPEPLRSYVEGMSRGIGCDPTMVMLPALAVLASCVGMSRSIELRSGWTEPCVVWTAVVARSGSMKSPACSAAVEPLHRLHLESMREYRQAREAFREKEMQHEAALQRWKKNAAGSPPPRAPDEPRLRRHYVSDTTLEALAPILEDNPRGLLLYRDEISAWFSSFDMYRGGRGGDVHSWIELFHGRPVTIDRKTSAGPVSVPCAAVSVTGTIQPETLSRVLDARHQENGFACRFLMAAPPIRRKRWRADGPPAELTAQYSSLVAGLLALQPAADADGMVQPVILQLSDSALEVWADFYDGIAARQHDAATDHQAAVLAKLEAYCARLALLFHLIRDVGGDGSLESPELIDGDSVRRAAEIVAWFEHEVMRLQWRLNEDETARERRELVDLVRARGGSMTPRKLTQLRRQYQPVLEAEKALEQLVAEGLGRWVFRQGAGRPSKVFELTIDAHVNGSTGPGVAVEGFVDVDTSERVGADGPSDSGDSGDVAA